MRTFRPLIPFLVFLVVGALIGYGEGGTLQSASKGAGVAGILFLFLLVFFGSLGGED